MTVPTQSRVETESIFSYTPSNNGARGKYARSSSERKEREDGILVDRKWEVIVYLLTLAPASSAC